MNKIIASFLALLAVTVAAPAFADTALCTSLTQDLSVGSRGSQVSQLQRFVVSQNYPGGGAWMVTGYYGAATAAGVRNFQQLNRLPTTGFVDAATRAAISRVSCGTVAVTTSTYVTSPYSYYYPYTNYGYNYNYGYINSGSLVLTSLSQNTGYAGNTVTIYGTGFDLSNNTVWLGSTAVAGIASSNGTSLTFTVPYTTSYSNSNASVQLSVQNSRGTSNALSFTINPVVNVPITCGSYGYLNCGSNAPISLSYITPVQGGVGTTVTIYGTGFSTTGNTVHFGTGIVTGLGSPDGQSISFLVPSQITGYGSQMLTLGSYSVSVSNASGATSNAVSFNVTSTNASGAPVISNVSGPSSLSVNQSGTWTITVNNPSSTYTNVSVNWGDSAVYGGVNTSPTQALSANGSQALSFSHSYLTSGTYTISFTATNSYGASVVSTATVTVSGSLSNAVSLTSVSPSSARVGTQIVLLGSGFTSDNTVHFGVGGTQHAYSGNGTAIYFTIPSYLSACDVAVSGTMCAMLAQQVTAGTYPVYVTNQNGSTQTIYFTVTN